MIVVRGDCDTGSLEYSCTIRFLAEPVNIQYRVRNTKIRARRLGYNARNRVRRKTSVIRSLHSSAPVRTSRVFGISKLCATPSLNYLSPAPSTISAPVHTQGHEIPSIVAKLDSLVSCKKVSVS